MPAEIRFLHSKPHGVLIMRLVGNLTAETIFKQLRHFFDPEPALVNSPTICDSRLWSGMIFDDELVAHRKWVSDFRDLHGLHCNDLPPVALLAHSYSGSTMVTRQFEGFRNQPIGVAFDPESAWAHLMPHIPLPSDVRKFLARR